MKTIKALYLVALLLTLPLRGFAAPMILPESGLPESGLHHEGMMMHAEMAGMDAMQHKEHGADGHQHDMPAKGSVECHACGACCTGALPGSLFSSISTIIPATTQAIPFIPRPYTGFIPDGPERPPRLS